MSTQTITARVDTDIVKMAKDLAKKNWISLSSIINLKLREFVDNKELKLVDNFDTIDDDLSSYDMFNRPIPIEEFLDKLKKVI